jgi:hypothetical protein
MIFSRTRWVPHALNVVADGALGLAATLAFSAELPPDAELIPLHNGINTVDLGAKVIAGLVVLAHRENFNAHSFEIATFYLRTRELESDPEQWQIVPFQIRSETGRMRNDVQVCGGADCQTHTFRLLRSRKEKAAYVVTADRAPGHSFADPGLVTFTWFQLGWNPDGGAGEPTASFKPLQTETTKKLYCDVDEALQSELHLGGAIMPKE